MTGSRRLRCFLAACSGLLLPYIAAFGLQPPTADQVKDYRGDGSFKERLRKAEARGNHRVDPGLVAQTRERLKRDYERAAGIVGPEAQTEELNAPPPAWQGGLPASGTPKALVMLVDFPDYPHAAGQTQTDVQNKFFGAGDSSRHPYDSLRNYYQRSSYSLLTITGNVLGWYRAQNNRSYYQGLGDGPGQETLMMEAMNYFDAQGHDFTQYDNNGDGKIDALFLKWTGPDNGWSEFWWAYRWSWHSYTSYRIDGKSLGQYVWSWISRPEGGLYQAQVDIHETGHLLGLPDLYDYDGSVGPDNGVGDLDMMDANWGDHNCFSKYMLGWLTPTTIVSGSQTLTLSPSGTSQSGVLMMPGISAGTLFSEFFMAQYRKRSTGNDPSNYPTDGLVVWHVDSTLTGGWYNFLYNNSYTAHKYIRLMEADGLEQIEQNISVNAGDYYNPPKTFGFTTTPNSRNYANAVTGVRIDRLTSAGTTMGARFAAISGPEIEVAGTAIVSESCLPGNGSLDPQETVTVSFSLQNVGIADTTNLVATLLGTGGVASPSAAQSYGALPIGGPAVTRPFTFVVSGACGDTLTATLQLQNGATSLAPVTIPFRIGVPHSAFAQDFDGVTAPALPGDWTATRIVGNVAPWATSTVSRDTSPNAAFASNPSSISDNWLTSPAVSITTATAQLSFRHSYSMQSGWDGGVLEISIGNGAFVDILTAGGSFATRGYTGQLNATSGNTIAGRQAWTGTSGGFVTETANLPPSAAGQNVRLRWRLGTDASVADAGWYVDTITISDGYNCCAPSIGDFNGDGDVDQDDFGKFQACFTGAGNAQDDSNCFMAKMDTDTDVDNDDFRKWLNCHTRDGTPADSNCRNLP